MKNKAIIFDIDGTAVDSPGQKLPSKRLVETIKKLLNSYYILVATGRVWSFVEPVLKVLELKDLCIISAGTQICEPVSGKIIWEKDIEPTALNKIIQVIKKYPDIKILYNDYVEKDYLEGGIWPKDFSPKEIVYFLEQIFVPENLAPDIYQQLLEIPDLACSMVVAQRPGFRDLHMMNKQATKEQAIGEVLKRLGIESKNTIGIGDGYNDIHLFNAVGFKVAMGNAVMELKAAADKIIGKVNEDGLSYYLESLSK